jgi:hypothetical protein
MLKRSLDLAVILPHSEAALIPEYSPNRIVGGG